MGNPNKTGGGFDEQTNAEADSREKEIRSIIKGNIDIIANVDSVGVLDKYSEEIDEAEEGGKSGIRPDEFKLMRDAISKRRTELALVEKEVSDVDDVLSDAEISDDNRVDNAEQDSEKMDVGEVITDNDKDKRRKEADAVLDDWLHGGSEKYSHYIINDEEDEAKEVDDISSSDDLAEDMEVAGLSGGEDEEDEDVDGGNSKDGENAGDETDDLVAEEESEASSEKSEISIEDSEAENDGTEVKSAYIAKLESERDERIDKINRVIDRNLAIDKKAMDLAITKRKAEGTITPEYYNNLATMRSAYVAKKEAERQQRIEEVQRDFNEKIANYSESGAEDEKLVPVMEKAPASSLGANGNMGPVIKGETWASDDGVAEEDEIEDYSVDVEGASASSLDVALDILKELGKNSDDDAAEEDKTDEVDVEGASSSSLDVALDILKGLKKNTKETPTDEDESLRPVAEVPASSIIKDNDEEIAKPESWEDKYVSSFDEVMRDYANHGGDEDEYNAKLKTLAEDFKKQGDWEFYGGKRTFEEYVHSLPYLVDRYLQSGKQKQKSIEKVIKKFDREDLEGMPLDRMTDALKIALADSRQISKFEECSKMLKEQYKKLGVREDGSLDDEAKKTSKFRKVADAIRRVIRLESE